MNIHTLIAKLIEQKFYGNIRIDLAGGHVVSLSKTERIRFEDDKSRPRRDIHGRDIASV